MASPRQADVSGTVRGNQLPKKSSYSQDIQNIMHYIDHEDEVSAVRFISKGVRGGGDFVERLLAVEFIVKDGDIAFGIKIFHYAAWLGMAILCKKLLDIGANINEQNVYNGLTALGFACEADQLNMVEQLLYYGADIEILNNKHFDVTSVTTSYEILQALVKCSLKAIAANKRGSSDSSPLFRSLDHNTDIVHLYCQKNNISGLNYLLSIDVFLNNIRLDAALHSLRTASWQFHHTRHQYDSLCQQINMITRKQEAPTISLSYPPSGFDLDMLNAGFPATMSDLFDCQARINDNCLIGSKAQVIRIAIAELNNLLAIPSFSYDFFRHVEVELIRYIDEKFHQAPEQLVPHQTQLKVIDDVMYKIPVSTDYIGLHKSHALHELLISMLRTHGLAKHMYKWVGAIIPSSIASPMLRAGDFCIEDKVGVSVLHGDLTHMFHILLIAHWLQTGMIHSIFQTEEGTIAQLTTQDLLDALFTHRHPIHQYTLFKATFDTRSSDVTLGDPHRLASIVMVHGHDLGFPVLADYLTDSFCHGYLVMLKAHNTSRDESCYLTVDSLAEQLSDLKTNILTDSQTVTDYAIARAKAKLKDHDKIIAEGEDYLVVEIDYPINTGFKPA